MSCRRAQYMEPKSPSHEFAAKLIFPLTAVAFATAIFVIDTFTPLGIAVAVLYVVVVLMAAVSSSAVVCSWSLRHASR